VLGILAYAPASGCTGAAGTFPRGKVPGLLGVSGGGALPLRAPPAPSLLSPLTIRDSRAAGVALENE
jgi:hypothetical protein